MKNLSVSLFALLMLVVLTGVMGSAQTSATTPPSQSTPQTQNAPQAQPHPQASPAQGGGQAKTVDEELQLTPDQKQKIQGVIDDENKQMGAIRDDSSLSLEQKQQKAISVRQDGATKIKSVLSPDQIQKLAALQEKARQQQNMSPSTPQ